jgi:YbbR domain-containing protein
LSIDLNGAKSGAASYPLNSTSFTIPRGVTVARITPPVVHLRLEPMLKRKVPVNVRVSGKLAAGYRVARTGAEPEMVSVEGPAEDVRRLTVVETVPIDIEGAKSSVRRKVRLAADGKQLSFSPDQVEISLAIEQEESSREFSRVEVQAQNFGGVYEANPKVVYVKLSGPKNLIDPLELGVSHVYLSLKGLRAGEHNLALSFDLPPGIKVLEQKPQRIRVRIVKPEP